MRGSQNGGNDGPGNFCVLLQVTGLMGEFTMMQFTCCLVLKALRSVQVQCCTLSVQPPDDMLQHVTPPRDRMTSCMVEGLCGF